jgi:competence protein ComEA
MPAFGKNSSIKSFFLKNKLSFVLGGLGLVLVIAGIVFSLRQAEKPATLQVITEEEGVKELFVHVAGAVKSPGLYKLNSSSRINDALAKAGGLSPEADNDWFLKHINLAQKLEDGAKLYIPFKGEIKTNKGEVAGENTAVFEKNGSSLFAEKININTASKSELETLPGIGPSYAQKIIDFRTENGFFSKLEDLIKVPGIGEKTFANLKNQITI